MFEMNIVELFLRMFFLVEYINSFQFDTALNVRNIFGTEYSIEHVHE